MFNIIHEEKSISAGMTMKLQGYLLGYSILQNGVIVGEHKYVEPVKNLVVNSGKDYLLKYQNSTSATASAFARPLFSYYGSTTAYSGVLGYCWRGASSTAATAADTALLSPIGNKTHTFLAGNPNTGTRFDRENGKIIMRVTHDHEVEAQDRNVNELGWFGGTEAAPVLFSRIVLPSTVTVLTGQSLRTVYQLEVTLSPISATSAAPSITGWTTDGDCRWECAFPATSSTFSSPNDYNFALFDAVGTNGVLPDGYWTTQCAERAGLLAYSTTYMCTMYGTAQSFNSFGTRPALPDPSATVYNACSGVGTASSGTATFSVSNYTNGNFYRDSTLVCEPNWTGYSSISIYAIRFRGLMYIFDNPQTKTNTQRLTLNYRISVT